MLKIKKKKNLFLKDRISKILGNDNISGFFLSLFIYFERERDSASRGRAERKEERIPSMLYAVSTQTDVGLKLMNLEVTT